MFRQYLVGDAQALSLGVQPNEVLNHIRDDGGKLVQNLRQHVTAQAGVMYGVAWAACWRDVSVWSMRRVSVWCASVVCRRARRTTEREATGPARGNTAELSRCASGRLSSPPRCRRHRHANPFPSCRPSTHTPRPTPAHPTTRTPHPAPLTRPRPHLSSSHPSLGMRLRS